MSREGLAMQTTKSRQLGRELWTLIHQSDPYWVEMAGPLYPHPSFGHQMWASSGRRSDSLWITQPLNELMAADGLLPSLPCWAVSSPFRETWGVHL